MAVRVGLQTVLEGQDRGIADGSVADLDSASDRVTSVPGIPPGEHRPQVRQQRLADLPRGGVPQVGRAVVDAVVVDVVPDDEGRLSAGGGSCPGETHALVAGDVDDQGARREGGQVVVDKEDQWRIGVLQHTVDDDVVPGQEFGERNLAVVGGHLAAARVVVVVVEVQHVCGVDR